MQRCKNVGEKKKERRNGALPVVSSTNLRLVSNDTINFLLSKRTLANTCPRFCLVARKSKGLRRGKVMAWEPATGAQRLSSRIRSTGCRNFNLPESFGPFIGAAAARAPQIKRKVSPGRSVDLRGPYRGGERDVLSERRSQSRTQLLALHITQQRNVAPDELLYALRLLLDEQR